MPGKRTHANHVVRILNSASEPIYALDEDLTIVFLNPACREWLGSVADGLIGTRCVYDSPTDQSTPEAIAAALCPPPEVTGGKNSDAIVHISSLQAPIEGWSGEGPGSRVERFRHAKFVAIGSPPHIRGILVILETHDCSAADASCDETAAQEASREELHAAIRRFRREAAGRFSADHLIGASPAIQLARHQAEAAAASGCSVCIAGPPGSGRERLANCIHYASNFQAAKTAAELGGIVALDCSLLPAELIFSTLAAMVRANSRVEEIEKTGPATLLLNRVDELSAEMQAEVAALFSRKSFPRRLISTAAITLAELVQRGKFRSDLAIVLSTMSIVLPPLNQRREDLPLLAQIFLEDCNRRTGKQVGGFAPTALDRLDAYAWPGNLDELAAVVAAAHGNARGSEIKVEELPEQIHLAAQAAAHPRKVEEPIRLDEFLERVERELIRRALARAKGNKTKAARLLGLTRPRLYRRMVQLGLEEG